MANYAPSKHFTPETAVLARAKASGRRSFDREFQQALNECITIDDKKKLVDKAISEWLENGNHQLLLACVKMAYGDKVRISGNIKHKINFILDDAERQILPNIEAETSDCDTSKQE